jgi:Zn-dependent membrane protease YugP
VPTVRIGSWLGPIIFIVGMLMQASFGAELAWIGIGLFGLTAVFALVTLPVELDASRRAKQALVAEGIVFQQEVKGVNAVLNAAALTYVAAAVQAISTMLYYVFLLSGSRRR